MLVKRIILIFAILFVLFTTACTREDNADVGYDSSKSFQQISQDEAKEMITKDDGHIIVDVRRFDEYDRAHIPGAICIPNESIENEYPEELPDLEQIILVYCRSGNRSKQASQKLVDMGYTNVYEFGGIIDWTGEIVGGERNETEEAVTIN
ncbi:MAG: rhodanese-like domain-containing protein [Firmicutes bacterium]|nr:rhodanese-like domain-containing protein [Bacillota bacterium]